jgi:glutamate dehydrogenase
VLLAYCKMWLFDEIVASDLPEDAWVGTALARYFPAQLRDEFGATSRAIRCAARSSPPTSSTAWSTASARRSCTAWRDDRRGTGAGGARLPGDARGHGHVALWQQVEALDNKVPDAVQSEC